MIMGQRVPTRHLFRKTCVQVDQPWRVSLWSNFVLPENQINISTASYCFGVIVSQSVDEKPLSNRLVDSSNVKAKV